jgi:dihydroorotase
MADSVARVRVFSDDGHCVFDPLVMRRALEYVKKFDGVIAQHAQEPRLTQGSQMNEGIVSSQLGLKGWPAIAEEAIIARDVLLADHVQARLHICHLTTAGGVEIIRWAKARGISVTAEVTPHHLLLTDELARSYDPVFKVNPPLRTEADVMALREALADGTIDIVATDHAPHPAETKECEWQEASFGMLGLETALSIINKTMLETGLMNWETVAERMSYAPARIGRYENQGQTLAVGAPAHITVMNPTEILRVDRDLVASRSRNTPFHGMELPGRILATIFNGKTVFEGGNA